MIIPSNENNGKKENGGSWKRSFLMYGVLALVVIAVALGAVQMLPGGSENSSAAVYSWNGAGTEDNPYQIGSVEDLANLADDVNTNGNNHSGDWFALTQDIYMNGPTDDSDPGWIPIGNSTSNAFYGNFSGNGHTIYNLFIYDTASSMSGLFGQIINSTVEKLRLADVNIAGGSNVGGLASVAYNCEFENCYITGTITGTSYVGGMSGTNSYCTVENCNVTGTVSGSFTVGGLIGLNDGTVENCHNEVDVILNGGGPYAGGVIGTFAGGTIRNCSNIGDVTSDGSMVGGVVGMCNYTVENCFAYGTVSGSNYVGGVAGYNGAGTINYCYSTGAVNCSGDHVGGVAGYNYGTVEYSYNTSTVTGSGSNVGGVVGYNGYTIENCYNIGAVTLNGDGDCVGGVAGINYGTVGNCYNIGDVTLNGDGDCVGGVTGQNDYSGSVENCFNAGAVSGNGDYVGGVTGGNLNSCTIENSFFLKVDGGINDGLSGYFDIDQNGNLNDGAEPKDWEEMHKEITYLTVPTASGGWDFDNVWGMYLKNDDPNIPDYGYPYLKTIDNYILITPDGGSKVYDSLPAPNPGWKTDNICDKTLFTGSLSYDPMPAIDVNTYNITLGDLDSPYYQIRFDNDIQYQITEASLSPGVSYTIDASSDTNSTILPAGQVSVQGGSSKTFTYSAASGYHISSVIVDGKAIDQDQITGSFTFTNIVSNHTIVVMSASGSGNSGSGTSVTLTVDIIGGNGTAEYHIGSEQYVSFTGAQIIPIGSDLYVSVVPDSGYSFVEWTGDVSSKNTEVNFSNVTSDIHLVAHLRNDNATGSAGQSGNFAWSNLILAILALLIGIVAVIAGIWSRKDEEKRMSGTAVIAGLLALIVGIISLIVFFLTEDLSAPMITTDNWTIWMAVLFVVAVILAVITFWAGGDRKAKGKD